MRPAMTPTATLAALLMSVSILSSGASAADTSGEKSGRYTMTPADGGALKLDTVTGATSFCTKTGTELECKPTKDGEQILRKQIDALTSDIAVLKEQLTKMEDVAGIGEPNKNPNTVDGPRPQSRTELPTEKEVDQAFDYFERMMKKLRERMNKLEGATKPGTPL
jgi:hypothetical protein